MNTNQFIEKARKIHGDKYDYSLVRYLNSQTNVKIICPDHGLFEQRPSNHLFGKKCRKCAFINSSNKQRNTTEQFIEKARKIHGNKYDYSLVEYNTTHTKVKIICPEHGIFEQKPSNHLNGQRCSACVGNRKISKLSIIENAKKIHDDKYDYSLVEYKDMFTNIKIICPIHGIFEQLPMNHIHHHGGCKFCSNNVKYTNDQFIEKARKIHGDKYDYSLVDYKNRSGNIIIICKEHGEFNQIASSHIRGEGCPKCSMSGTSYKEKELLNFIEENYNGEIIENSRSIISPLELDIYLPDLKLAFEFNGLYWHNELYVDKNYHLNKTKLCEENGIHLVHIYEDDWLFKNEIVKSRILNLLGKTERKIFGRKCEIKEVPFGDSKEFLIKNHIQGNVNSKIRLGLYYKEELVSLMTFGNLRKNLGSSSKDNSYELLRFCNKINTNVIGGANKLYKYFRNKYKPKEILSYADRSWTMNNDKSLYNKLGFDFVGETAPNYYYIRDGERKNRFGFRKDILVKEGFDPSKTERNIMFERGIYRIYDCGSLKYGC